MLELSSLLPGSTLPAPPRARGHRPDGTRPGRGRQCSESPPIEPPYCLSLRFKTRFSTCKRTYRSHGKGFKTGRRLWPPSAARPDPHPRAALLPRARPVACWHAVEGDHCQRRRCPAEQPVRRVPSRAAGPRSPPPRPGRSAPRRPRDRPGKRDGDRSSHPPRGPRPAPLAPRPSPCGAHGGRRGLGDGRSGATVLNVAPFKQRTCCNPKKRGCDLGAKRHRGGRAEAHGGAEALPSTCPGCALGDRGRRVSSWPGGT